MTLRTLADGAAARLRARDSAAPAPPVRRPRGSAQHAWPALAGLGLGLLAIGPGLAPGFLLSYDMVFVPRMPFSAALIGLTGGPPRAVPSDAAVAVASLLIPADLLQRLILLLIFVLACSGAAALLASGWTAATGPAAACRSWPGWRPGCATRGTPTSPSGC